MKIANRLVFAAAFVAALSGCSTMEQIHQQAHANYAFAKAQANAYALQSKTALDAAKAASKPIVLREPFVNTTKFRYRQSSTYLDQKASINIQQRMPATSLASLLEAATGMTVRMDRSVLYTSSSPQAAPPPQMDSTLQAAPASAAGSPVYTPIYVGPLSYSGSAHGLLNAVAASMGATWKYDSVRNRVSIFRDETRVFHVDTLPISATSMDSKFGGGGQQDIQGGTGQILRLNTGGSSLNYTSSTDIWKDLQVSVRALLSPKGTMVISESDPSVMVHDYWRNVAQVKAYIDHLNKSLSEEVAINVRVYEVKLNNEDNRGISWNLLYNAMKQSIDEPALGLSVPRPIVNNGSSLVLTAPSVNRFSNSQFFIDALSTLGKVSVVDDETQNTVNNVPVAFKVFRLNSYLAQTTPSLYSPGSSAASTGSSAGLTPGAVETGLNVSLLPSVQPDGKRIVMQMSLSDTILDSFGTAQSGGEAIQLPNTSGRESVMRTWLRSGQSYVVAGYQNLQSNSTINTPFTKTTWLAGGNRDITNAKDVLVVVVTPVATAYDATMH